MEQANCNKESGGVVAMFCFESDQAEPVVKKVVGQDKSGKDILVDVHKQRNVVACGADAARQRAKLGDEYQLARVFALSKNWQVAAEGVSNS